MEILYFIVVKAYSASIFLASIFNSKARQWVQGRIGWIKKLKLTLKPGEQRILFHCASLGEYEQGKPLLEALKKEYPDHKMVLTFFSPSGYEVKKNESIADYVFYLPSDGPINSKTFIDLINPSMAFFVKYEFWHFYIKALRKKKVPVYIVSAIFRPSQLFFQPYGKFFYNMLVRVSHIFVQNQASLELLYNHSIAHVSVTGDTRFDRVFQNSLHSKELTEFKLLKNDKKLLVAGSTWKADEKLLFSLYSEIKNEFRLVIAPHETGDSRIAALVDKFGASCIQYSKWNKTSVVNDIIIIDNIGMLSSIYKYADVAYVGGGFGSGIHNILEATVFGIPVFFGPKYSKFREAKELVHWKGAFSVKNEEELISKFQEVTTSTQRLQKINEINLRYIDNNKGSTDLIISFLKINLKQTR